MSETVSLREYLEIKIQHERELREVREKEIERRLEAMNELREQINRERGTFLTREMYDTKGDLQDKRLALSETKLSNMAATRSTLTWLWGAVLGAAGLVVAILHWLSALRAGQH